MITHDVKPTLKKHFGFNAFQTTPLTPENTPFIVAKSSICMLGHSQANQPTNYGFIPSISIICYNNAITYFKRSFLKCI